MAVSFIFLQRTLLSLINTMRDSIKNILSFTHGFAEIIKSVSGVPFSLPVDKPFTFTVNKNDIEKEYAILFDDNGEPYLKLVNKEKSVEVN